jgi:molybdopterin/thiamine biosynthesis adenylyltransferase
MSERYSRHELIPGWSQHRMAAASVVVVGVGALGTEVARQLAQMGVGRLVLCDGDAVTVSNLSRGALFRPDDVGRPKVAAAAAAIRELTTDTTVVERPRWLVCGVGLGELREATLVISCLDSRAARVQLAMRCNLAGVGLLDGGTHPWGGEVRYYPAGGPCFGCGLTEVERSVRDDPVSCTDPRATQVGASAGVSGLIGSWLAVTASQLLFDLEVPPGTLRVQADTGRTERHRFALDPRCPLHERIEPETVTRTRISSAAPVGRLLELVRPYETVLTWTEFDGARNRRSSHLKHAARDTRLHALGVAPQEILRVVPTTDGLQERYIELAAGRDGEG